MASEIVLKHFQIFRNENIGTYANYAEALTAAKTAWASTFVADKKLKDGEFVLFNYKLTDSEKVESILGIVRSGAIDIIGSYDQLTSEYQAYVNSAINNLADVAHSGAAADVAVATGIEGLTANNVQGALAELQDEIATLQAIDPVVTTVVEGTGIKVTDTITGNDHAYTVAADFTVDTIKYGEDAGNKAGKTYIRILDGETVISETDAAAFVKDGFLASVTKDATTNELVFIWNTDAEAGEANQITRIDIKDLCDVYTVGEGLVASEYGYKFSHQAGATELPTTAVGSGSVTANKITVKVPSVTVDKFGHVSALTENEVSLEIPASVASAVQTVTKPENEKYLTINRNVNDVTISTNVADVENSTATERGLADSYDVQQYVGNQIGKLNADVTSTTGTNVQVQVVETDGKITAVNVSDYSINATDLQNAIKALDTPEGGVSSAETNNVKVTVKQVDGIVNSVEVVDNSVNATDVSNAITAAINELDSTKSNVEALTNGAATNDIRVEVVETDGKLTSVKVTDTLAKVAHSGKAADVAIADAGALYTAENVEAALAEVMTKANALQDAQLSAGKGIDIDGTTINADLKLSIANETTGEGESVVTTTYLYIKDTEGNEISKVNANAFVKDGFLQEVELIEATAEGQENVLRFTWNSDAGIQVTEIKVSDLCDVYTAKENDWIQLNGFEFSHKTSGVTADTYATNTADVTVDSTTEKSFNVPTLTVDDAGHVTAASEKTVTIKLPTEIDTAVQTVTAAQTEVLSNTKFVAVKATRAEGSNDVVLTSEVKTQAVASATANTNGLATALDVKSYVDTQVGTVNTAIENLDGTATIASVTSEGVVTLKAGIVETNGKIANNNEADITLAKVATTGKAADMSIADTDNKFTATTVEGALLELVSVDTWDAGTY